MPLSEHEQRMLDQIERALYDEDPKFANTVRQTTPQAHYRGSIVKSSVGFFLGIGLLMGGVIVNNPIGYGVSALGFLIMLACALWFLAAWRRMVNGGGEAEPAAAPSRKQQRGGMMNRFEERWKRRQEGDS
ncbi:DUF3040 domain-containing protein [Spiractinospora alimapuensis]|uniref:DUF3040 domain-containing protein n=1 Tax=Spiractinospora alimapuensis TaxID=2820884 RepID=UPI001F1E52ED|nr:DUF3040 domain-containing protein [Spiractinospora alimapuensis]QVQ53144.1 DUF3040 domain-containing protein [Spiractinospora alimapuensis]